MQWGVRLHLNMKPIKMTLKGYLVTGLLLWLPLAVTLWVLNLIVGTLDQTLNLLPMPGDPNSCSVSTFPEWAWCSR